VRHQVPCITTTTGALAAVEAIGTLREDRIDVRSLQELHAPDAALAATVGAAS
jgi:hypothetical protein